MSITSTGAASGAGNLNQLLASMLSRIQSTQAQDTSTVPPPSTTAASSDTNNALTGTDTSTLSDQVINTLVMMQTQDPSQATASASSGSDPVSQAFSSLDSNGDGSISQSELESAITNAGGTASEADTVYAALGGTDQTGISQVGFASAAQSGAPSAPAGPPPGGHAHHHHHGGGGSSTTSASNIFSALDTNQDGSVSDDELTALLGGSSSSSTSGSTPSDGTATGGTSDIFSAIDTNGDGSVSQNELTSYLDNLQNQVSSDQTTLNAFQQLANQSYNTNLSLMASSASTQMATA